MSLDTAQTQYWKQPSRSSFDQINENVGSYWVLKSLISAWTIGRIESVWKVQTHVSLIDRDLHTSIGNKTMTHQSNTTELKAAVLSFQNEVDRQVKLNDMQDREAWKSRVRDAFETMNTLAKSQREEVHKKLFTEIASRDGSHQDEVREFQLTDKRNHEFTDVVNAHIAAFAVDVMDEPVGEEIEVQLSDLRTASHELAASILDQENCIYTWFAEAFATEADSQQE
jgi:hypothetical protein